MEMNVHAVATQIHETAQRIVAARWNTIANFFGASLRPHNAFPLSMVPREPYAPGFGASPDEFHASAYATVDIGPDVLNETAYWADQAAYRIEEQVRAGVRSNNNAALELGKGQKFQAVFLAGATAPIRCRVTQVGNQFRLDVDLLIRKVSHEECLLGVSARLTPAVLPLIETGMFCTQHREKPLRLLFDSGTLDNGMQVAVVLGRHRGGFAPARGPDHGRHRSRRRDFVLAPEQIDQHDRDHGARAD